MVWANKPLLTGERHGSNVLPSAPSLKASALAPPGNDASPRWLADFFFFSSPCQDCVLERRADTGSSPKGEGRIDIVRARDVGWVGPEEGPILDLLLFLLRVPP